MLDVYVPKYKTGMLKFCGKVTKAVVETYLLITCSPFRCIIELFSTSSGAVKTGEFHGCYSACGYDKDVARVHSA